MKRITIITGVFIAVMFNSCSIKKCYVQFDHKNHELIATEKIKILLKQNPSPSIVLRVPQAAGGATQSDPNNHVYTAIEKELVIAGFNPKDRGLFNQVLNSQTALDYSKINDLTGTDLILELVKVDDKIPFTTNRAYDIKDGKQKIGDNPKMPGLNQITRFGASIEFKLIIVKNNEYGGSYLFNYTPCDNSDNNSRNDCNCQLDYAMHTFFVKDYCGYSQANGNQGKAYEAVPQNEFEIFVRNGVKKVIASIREPIQNIPQENSVQNSQASQSNKNIMLIENYLGVKLETSGQGGGVVITSISKNNKLKFLGNYALVGNIVTKMNTSGGVNAEGILLSSKEIFASTLIDFKKQGFTKVFIMGATASGGETGYKVDITDLRIENTN